MAVGRWLLAEGGEEMAGGKGRGGPGSGPVRLPEGYERYQELQQARAVRKYGQPTPPPLSARNSAAAEDVRFGRIGLCLVVGLPFFAVGMVDGSGGWVMFGSGCLVLALGFSGIRLARRPRRRVRGNTSVVSQIGRGDQGRSRSFQLLTRFFGLGLIAGGSAHLGHWSWAAALMVTGVVTAVPALALAGRYALRRLRPMAGTSQDKHDRQRTRRVEPGERGLQ